MEQIDKSLEQLLDAIKQSDEYLRYQKIKDNIHLEPEKENAVNEFRRRNYDLQNNKDNRDIFQETDRMQREYANFMREPLVSEYLAAELAFCRLVQRINWKIMENLEFGL